MKTPTRPDTLNGISSCTVAIATFIATGDREKARLASKRFGAELGARKVYGITFDELFDFLEEGR